MESAASTPDRDPMPSRGLLWSMTIVWCVAAVVLFWLGFVLSPADVEATEGLHRILFTVVPIQAFSWVMSVVFLGIGVMTGRAALRGGGPDEAAPKTIT